MSVEAMPVRPITQNGLTLPGGNLTKEAKDLSLNALNALISFGIAMTYTSSVKEIHRTALNPTISYLRTI